MSKASAIERMVIQMLEAFDEYQNKRGECENSLQADMEESSYRQNISIIESHYRNSIEDRLRNNIADYFCTI